MKLCIALTALIVMATPAIARPLDGTTWRTATGGGTIRIEACGAKTCGRILSGAPRLGDTATSGGLDTKNPNPTMRARSLIGVNILTGFTRQADDSYKGGTIYNPEDGKTYRSEIKLKRDGNLEVKGCLGPFCQNQVWTPIR